MRTAAERKVPGPMTAEDIVLVMEAKRKNLVRYWGQFVNLKWFVIIRSHPIVRPATAPTEKLHLLPFLPYHSLFMYEQSSSFLRGRNATE